MMKKMFKVEQVLQQMYNHMLALALGGKTKRSDAKLQPL